MAERGPRARTLLAQGARALGRDLRNPHFVVVVLALVVAVAAMTAVATFTDRIGRALTQQASHLLAGDLVLQSTRPLDEGWPARAAAQGLAGSAQLGMRSMVSRDGRLQMVELKAVDSAYPLRGELLIAPAAFADAAPAQGAPPAGTVWVEARLLSSLDLAVGDLLRVGSAELRVAGVLVLEPDRAGDLFSIAPRVMLNLADVPATRLVLPGSRVQYALALAGAPAAVAAFARDARAAAPAQGFKVLEPAEARPEVRSALEHAQQFLGLAALLATALSGLAILVAAHGFAREQVDAIAIWRTLGATRGAIGWRYTAEILLLGAGAASLGAALGSALEFGLAQALSGWLQGALPAASPWPALSGIVTGMLALAGFALPQLLALRDVSPARVLRREAGWRAPRPGVIVGSAVAAVALLAPWRAGDPEVTAVALAGLAGCLAALYVSGRGLLRGLQTLQQTGAGWWRTAFANLTRRPGLASLQICALGLSGMAIMLLALVRTDVVGSWAASLPPDAPDQFLINIAPGDVPALEDLLASHGIRHGGLHAMIRARLVAINARQVRPEDYPDPRARRFADREFNLSAATAMKADNRLVDGRFWPRDATATEFSFEVEIAETLGIRLGDVITWRVADRELRGPVTSLRAVNWETMDVNFFVVAPPAAMADHPATYIASFKLPDGRFDILREIAQRFPSVTVIDVKALVRQVRSVMDKALAAIEFVFLFTLAAGLIVVFAAVQATHGERLHDATVLKTLGATRRRVLAITSLEFLTLGALAGIVGAVAASAAAWVLASQVLHLDTRFNPLLPVVGAIAGMGAVWLAGLRAVFATWRQPVAEVLRDWS